MEEDHPHAGLCKSRSVERHRRPSSCPVVDELTDDDDVSRKKQRNCLASQLLHPNSFHEQLPCVCGVRSIFYDFKYNRFARLFKNTPYLNNNIVHTRVCCRKEKKCSFTLDTKYSMKFVNIQLMSKYGFGVKVNYRKIVIFFMKVL